MNLRADSVSTRDCVSKYAPILVEFFFALMFSLIFVGAAFSQHAGVIINEVLANEPGSNTKLEWVEVHNADSVGHDLEGWSLISKDDTTWFPAEAIISAG